MNLPKHKTGSCVLLFFFFENRVGAEADCLHKITPALDEQSYEQVYQGTDLMLEHLTPSLHVLKESTMNSGIGPSSITSFYCLIHNREISEFPEIFCTTQVERVVESIMYYYPNSYQYPNSCHSNHIIISTHIIVPNSIIILTYIIRSISYFHITAKPLLSRCGMGAR